MGDNKMSPDQGLLNKRKYKECGEFTIIILLTLVTAEILYGYFNATM